MARSSAPTAPTAPAPPREATAGPDRDRGRDRPRSARSVGETVEIWLAPALLVISWTVGLLASFTWMSSDWFRWAIVPSAVLLALRPLLERTLRRTGPDSPALRALSAVHVLVTAAAVLTNPMACIYAFIGYVDSVRFLRGGRSRALVVLTALLCAVGQVGGVSVVREEGGFFLGLAAVNLLIASGMLYLTESRESALLAREQALAETQRVQEENARLHDRLLEGARRAGADEERTRLSREIHDTVAQGLVGVIRQLEAVGQGTGPETGRRIAVAEEAARDCLVEARRAVEALGPHQLHEHDLASALSVLVARWSRTHRVVATLEADDAPDEVRHADVLLRIAQEALANVARHAEASTATVALGEDGRRQLLRITDDGGGFDAERGPRGHGLANMAARLRGIGGWLEVSTAPGEGTTITASVPR